MKRDVALARGAQVPFPLLHVETVTLAREDAKFPRVVRGVQGRQVRGASTSRPRVEKVEQSVAAAVSSTSGSRRRES